MTRLLTIDDADSGIYIDFEGRTDLPPILLGISTQGTDDTPALTQVVLDETFAPAADAASLDVLQITSVVETLVDRAGEERVPLIGWSAHEVDVVESHCSPELARRFKACYVDAKDTARAAKRASRSPQPPARGRVKGHALARYMELVGFDVPWPFGPGRTGNTIQVLEAALDRHADWLQLTPRQRARWSLLLSHNRYDCEGTRSVAQWATGILARAA